jgi:outer membrane protein OmpA-like peptidoglycan-associated protein
MKKSIMIVVVFMTINVTSRAQLIKGIGNIVKTKTTQKATGELEKKIDGILNGKSKTKEQPNENSQANNSVELTPGNRISYSKFDFVPGENIIYFDDFASAPLGELPLGWNASGKGEVVALEGINGKWLRMFPGTMYLSANTKPLGENYTIEFDLLMNGTPPSGTRFLPDFVMGLLSTGKLSTTHNSFLDSHTIINNMIQIMLKPNVDRISTIKMESFGPSKISTFKTGTLDFPEFSETLNGVAAYSLQVQKQRFRMWINGKKMFDVPRAINASPALNQLYFKPAEYWPYNESNFGLYLSNFRVASGILDTRSRLIEEGKLSTTGILFKTGSSEISPQSFGLLKEIGSAISSNKEMKFRIVGHTDNVGDPQKNLALSEKRSQAVYKYLIENYNIDSKSLEFEGKGPSSPVADNKSEEGKAQNRRVEFIRI